MEKSRFNFKNFLIELLEINLLTPQAGAFVILGVGIILAIAGFRVLYPDDTITVTILLHDFYANASMTLIGIAVTVLIIDALNRRRDDGQEKIRLIRDMGCGDHGIALSAVAEITERNLHWKGFLRNRLFCCAKLGGAQLISADLSYSSFHHSDLTGTVLFGAILVHTCFWHAQLHGVDFRDANLTDADFIFADLTNACITQKQLQSANRLLGVRLPNGKIYDGRFNRPGDLIVAKALGININDQTSRRNFYAMTYDEFVIASDWRKDRPEITDWKNW